jgi:hypothetical protein
MYKEREKETIKEIEKLKLGYSLGPVEKVEREPEPLAASTREICHRHYRSEWQCGTKGQ